MSSKADDQILKIREEIDSIDDELLHLIKKRLDLTGEIGDIKKENQIEVIDSPREKAMFDALKDKCRELDLDANFVSKIWQEILKASYRSQE